MYNKGTYGAKGLMAPFRLVSVFRGYTQEKGRLTGIVKDVLFFG